MEKRCQTCRAALLALCLASCSTPANPPPSGASKAAHKEWMPSDVEDHLNANGWLCHRVEYGRNSGMFWFVPGKLPATAEERDAERRMLEASEGKGKSRGVLMISHSYRKQAAFAADEHRRLTGENLVIWEQYELRGDPQLIEQVRTILPTAK
jgi:hypothetical protein